MTEIMFIYKCEICGNIVEVLHPGSGILVCCGKPMIKLQEKLSDEEKGEKHVPFIEELQSNIVIKIGEIEHPMTEEHHIEWIEVVSKNGIFRKYLKIDEKPELKISKEIGKIYYVREYCNLHGLWKLNL